MCSSDRSRPLALQRVSKGVKAQHKGTADEWQGHYPKRLETLEILMLTLTDAIDGAMVHDA
jgi:hypothetical protein